MTQAAVGGPPPDEWFDDGGVDVAARPFVAAKKFTGARPGMVFKTGCHCLGYGCDVPAPTSVVSAAEQLPRERVDELDYLAPLATAGACLRRASVRVLALADLLVDDAACPGWRGKLRRRAPRSVRRGRSTRPRGQAAGVSYVANGPAATVPRDWQPPLEVGDVKAGMSHRQAGVLASDSYSGSAMSTAHTFLTHSGADVCFVQGSRVAGDQLRTAERQAARAKRSLTLEPAAATAAGSLSAGVGIAVRTHLGHAPSPVEHCDPNLESRVKFSWM